MSRTPIASSISDDSVSSSVRSRASRPDAVSAASTWLTTRPFASWRLATLTAIPMSGPGNCRFHVAASAHACCKTQAPMSVINPVSSASAMKSPGSVSLKPGRDQRTSASKCTVSPVAVSTIGW